MTRNLCSRFLAAWALLLATAAIPAAAGVVSISGVLSGQRGDIVSPQLADSSLSNLEAADLKLTFDPMVLELLDTSPGGLLTNAFTVVAGAPSINGDVAEVLVSMITGGDGVSSGPGTVLDTLFRILPNATFGVSFVRFETLDASLYDFAPIAASIDVRQGPLPLPAPGTTLLVTLALLALAGTQRRLRC